MTPSQISVLRAALAALEEWRDSLAPLSKGAFRLDEVKADLKALVERMEAGDCGHCGGLGWVEGVAQVCCGNVNSGGECRGDCSIAEQTQEQCAGCNGTGKSQPSPTPEVEQSEAELEHLARDGWIDWKGVGCPVPDDTIVEILCKDGDRFGPAPAKLWVWSQCGMGTVIAYRIADAKGQERGD